jgi:hypothetical protein
LEVNVETACGGDGNIWRFSSSGIGVKACHVIFFILLFPFPSPPQLFEPTKIPHFKTHLV